MVTKKMRNFRETIFPPFFLFAGNPTYVRMDRSRSILLVDKVLRQTGFLTNK